LLDWLAGASKKILSFVALRWLAYFFQFYEAPSDVHGSSQLQHPHRLARPAATSTPVLAAPCPEVSLVVYFLAFPLVEVVLVRSLLSADRQPSAVFE